MKKIYSFVLMAVALLIGTNAWATVRTAGSANELETQWKEAQSGDVIRLTSSFSIDKTLWLGTTTMADPNLISIELDLNGQTLTSTAQKVFVITHGALKVTGTGTIHHNIADYYEYSNGKRVKDSDTGQDKVSSAYEAFRVLGSTYKDVDSKTAAEENLYSHLTIGENVRIIAISGIAVDCNSGAAVCTSTNSWAIGNTTYPTWADLKTKVYPSGYGVAHGVRIDIKGYIEAVKYAVTAKGNLGIQTSDTVKYGTTVAYKAHRTSTSNDYVIERRDDNNYSPYFHIYSTAEVITKQFTSKASVAVYGGGFARWYIEGKCVGSTGLYAKSGEVQLKDAEIASNFDGDKMQTGTDRGSGVAAGGSGVVIESSTNYSGGTGVSVTGDTKVTATSGYAIEETITAKSGESKVSSIEITGGTLEAGEAGAISITQGTAGKSDTIVSVTGGNIGVNATDSVGNKSLSEYLAGSTDSHITYVTVEDPETHAKTTTMVISDGPAPLASNKVSNQEANATVKWEGPLFVKDTIKTGTLVLKELQINDTLSDGTARVQSLVINEGATLQVERVILGQKAQIIVEAGAKFIVTGSKGIVAPAVENIVLRSNETSQAIFLFNPKVSSNKHPNATVEFNTYSFYDNSGHYQFQRFGVPTWEAIQSIECGVDGLRTRIYVFGDNGWENLGEFIQGQSTFANISRLNQPFACYNLMAYQAATGAKYTMTGALVGNVDAQTDTRYRWSPFANSYTAEIDIMEMLDRLTFADVNDRYIYIATGGGNGTYNWQSVDENWYDDNLGASTKIAPMQPFLLHVSGTMAEEHKIDYEKMVWDPVMNPTHASAPRRAASNSDLTARLRVIITNEQGAWDNVKMTENVSEKYAEKYMNEEVNIYAHADVNCAIVAKEELADTYLGVSTVKGGNFTLSFANVEGRQFDVIDLETGARVAAMEGSTYEFHMDANTVADYRFKIVERAEVITAIDNTEAVKNAKGIYTITGQYVGEMNVWNTLPAGVYVVNGEKLVK